MLVINCGGQTRPVGRSREGLVVGPVIRLSASGNGVFENRLLSGVAHPRPKSGSGSGQCLGC